MKRITAVLAAVLLGGLGLLGPARAAIPSPTSCEQQANYNTLLTSPLLIEVGWRTGPPGPRAVVCVGTTGAPLSGVSYQEVLVEGQAPGPGPALACDGSGYTGGHAAGGFSGIGFGGGVGYGTAPSLCPQGDGTYTLAVPIIVCVGGACPENSTQNVYKTGAVVGTFSTTPPPPGTSTGAGLQLTSVTLWVDNVKIPLASAGGALGVNSGAVAPATSSGGGIPVCVAGTCVAVPPSASLSYTGQSLVTVSALGVSEPVYIPGGQQCLLSEGHTTNYPCS
jgi:hypothetical protein